MAVSARSGRGVDELLGWLDSRIDGLRDSGELERRRDQQLKRAFHAALSRELRQRLAADAQAATLLPSLEAAVAAGKLLPSVAARQLATTLFAR
jgi:LAO/AO transport system kinase